MTPLRLRIRNSPSYHVMMISVRTPSIAAVECRMESLRYQIQEVFIKICAYTPWETCSPFCTTCPQSTYYSHYLPISFLLAIHGDKTSRSVKAEWCGSGQQCRVGNTNSILEENRELSALYIYVHICITVWFTALGYTASLVLRVDGSRGSYHNEYHMRTVIHSMTMAWSLNTMEPDSPINMWSLTILNFSFSLIVISMLRSLQDWELSSIWASTSTRVLMEQLWRSVVECRMKLRLIWIVGLLVQQKLCHKLHSAISPSILQLFSWSQQLWKALKKTFQSMPVTSWGDQYWLRYQADQLVTTMVPFIKLLISQKLPWSMLQF